MPSSLWKEEAKWIWVSPYDDSTDPGKFVLFRKVFHIQNTDFRECIVRVSADTRYRPLSMEIASVSDPARAIRAAGTTRPLILLLN